MKIVHGYGAKEHTWRKSFIPQVLYPNIPISDVTGFHCHHFLLSEFPGLSRKYHFRQNKGNICVSVRVYICIIQSHVINFQPFLTRFDIFHAFNDFFELNDPEIEKRYKWTLKRLKVGIVSSFHPHSMCKKVERVRAKTVCTSYTKSTVYFEVSWFPTKTHLLQRDFIYLNLFELQTFCVLKMHHSKPHHQFSTLSDFICYFSCIYWFFELNDPEIEKHFKWTNGLKLPCYISSFHPHSMF